MKKDSFNYNSINYPVYKVGSGEKSVLVLHGWGSKYDSWKDFFDSANSEYTFHFLEMPGFGEAPNPPRAWSVDNYKEYVQAYLNSLEEKPKLLLVHSFGGRIAIKLLNEPHSFKKAIFVGAAGIREPLPVYKKLIQIITPLFRFLRRVPFIRRIIYKLIGASDYEQAQGTMEETMRLVINEDLTHMLSSIEIPVQLVWGKGDTYTPIRMAHKMKELIPNSNLTIIDEARHGVHMQTPAKLATIMDEFFNK